MSILAFQDFTYQYPGASDPALKNISLEIARGEFAVVAGLNNAGKSTLLTAAAGVVPHLYNGRFDGRVLINGQDSTTSSVAQIAEHTGLVMSRPHTQLSGVRYTVFEEVAFGLENRGVPRETMRTRVLHALEQTGLAELAEQSPYELSGGQQQKLVIAAGLATKPDTLILDEPTSFLDPESRRHIFAILKRLHEGGTTILLAEHELGLCSLNADKVVVLKEGRITLSGTPREVLTSQGLEATGLDRLAFTKVALLAAQNGIWDANTLLPISFEETVHGLTPKGVAE